MKVPPNLIVLFYLVLIVSGSWYFGNYSNREYSPADSDKHFKQCIATGEKGMTDKEKKSFDNLAGVSGGRGL